MREREIEREREKKREKEGEKDNVQIPTGEYSSTSSQALRDKRQLTGKTGNSGVLLFSLTPLSLGCCYRRARASRHIISVPERESAAFGGSSLVLSWIAGTGSTSVWSIPGTETSRKNVTNVSCNGTNQRVKLLPASSSV